MRWSINLGRLFGIKVLVHWTFFLILIYIGFISIREDQSIQEMIIFTLLVLTLFVCVVLHELGHALTARHYGIETRRIILLPIGGVAQLERMPEEPKEELVVAIMGPVVNVVIAALLLLVLAVMPGFQFTQEYILEGMGPGIEFLFSLMIMNIFLVVFNLIPAFPMDGGRMLRAILASRIDYVEATTIAARIGQGFAILFAVAAIYWGQYVLLIIAIFVYLGAQGEANMVKNRFVLRSFRVKHGMLSRFVTLNPNDDLMRAVKELLAGSDKDFLVVDHERQVTGILTRDKLVESLSDKDKNTPIADVMIREFPNVSPEENLQKAVMIMREKNLPILPVIKDGELVGAISMENISELFLVNKPLEVEERMMPE